MFLAVGDILENKVYFPALNPIEKFGISEGLVGTKRESLTSGFVILYSWYEVLLSGCLVGFAPVLGEEPTAPASGSRPRSLGSIKGLPRGAPLCGWLKYSASLASLSTSYFSLLCASFNVRSIHLSLAKHSNSLKSEVHFD